MNKNYPNKIECTLETFELVQWSLEVLQPRYSHWGKFLCAHQKVVCEHFIV